MLALLAVGNFVVGIGAFIIIGIMSSIAAAIGVSESDAGIILTSYAVAYALLSPIGAALTGSLPRRTVLAAALGMFCLGTLLSALAVSLPMLTASRVLVAFGAALYTPLSAGVAVAITPPELRGRALAKVFSGMTMAQIFGVPLGAWLAYRFGWHGPFYVVAAGAALCAVLLIRAMISDRIGPYRALLIVIGGQILMLPLFAIIPLNPYLLGLLVFVWSSFAWGYVPPQQSRLVGVAPHAPSLALAINAAMSYMGIALGSAAGASLFAWQGLSILGIGGGALAILAIIYLTVSNRFILQPKE